MCFSSKIGDCLSNTFLPPFFLLHRGYPARYCLTGYRKTGDLLIDQQRKDYRTGLLCVLLCQVSWGILPLFWNLLDPIPSQIIILYRVVTMFLCSYVAARSRYSRAEVWGPFRQRRIRWKYIAAGFVLTINWSIYIWAVTSGRILQATIGYYIEPLVICLVGILFFK